MITSTFLPKALLIQDALPQLPAKVCDMTYLLSMSRGNKMIIQNILAVFFTETATELICLQKAINSRNYTAINNISHKLRSAFSILGIAVLEPVFKEIDQLSSSTSSIGIIELLNRRVNIIFNQAKAEMNPDN